MSVQELNYRNKYLKYKKKYLDLTNTNIINELMSQINKFANLDYETKYVMFGGDINNLYNEYKLYGGGFYTDAAKNTLISAARALYSAPINAVKGLKQAADFAKNKLITGTTAGANIMASLYHTIGNMIHAELVSGFIYLFTTKPSGIQLFTALKTKLSTILVGGAVLSVEHCAAITATAYQALFVYLHANKDKVEDDNKPVPDKSLSFNPFTRNSACFYHVYHLMESMDGSVLAVPSDKVPLLSAAAQEPEEAADVNEILGAFNRCVAGLKGDISKVRYGNLAAGVALAFIPGAQLPAVAITAGIEVIMGSISSIIGTFHMFVETAFLLSIDNVETYYATQDRLKGLINDSVLFSFFPFPDVYTRFMSAIERMVLKKIFLMKKGIIPSDTNNERKLSTALKLGLERPDPNYSQLV